MYKLHNGTWKIITHHSSALPEPESPKPVPEKSTGRKMLNTAVTANVSKSAEVRLEGSCRFLPI